MSEVRRPRRDARPQALTSFPLVADTPLNEGDLCDAHQPAYVPAVIRNALLSAVAIATLIVATPSYACRVNLPPDRRLARGYAVQAISAVALVRITAAQYTQPAFGDARPWRAFAKVKRTLHGSYAPRTLSFDRGWGSAACDDGRSLPKTGELWVIYFWTRGTGDQPVWQSYPLEVARRADPMIARRPDQRP